MARLASDADLERLLEKAALTAAALRAFRELDALKTLATDAKFAACRANGAAHVRGERSVGKQ